VALAGFSPLWLAHLVLAKSRQAQPASSDFFVGPRGDDIGTVPHNETGGDIQLWQHYQT
jgi:hypothetical protein